MIPDYRILIVNIRYFTHRWSWKANEWLSVKATEFSENVYPLASVSSRYDISSLSSSSLSSIIELTPAFFPFRLLVVSLSSSSTSSTVALLLDFLCCPRTASGCTPSISEPLCMKVTSPYNHLDPSPGLVFATLLTDSRLGGTFRRTVKKHGKVNPQCDFRQPSLFVERSNVLSR